MDPLAILVMCVVVLSVGLIWEKEQIRAFTQRWRWVFLGLAAIDAVVLLVLGV